MDKMKDDDPFTRRRCKPTLVTLVRNSLLLITPNVGIYSLVGFRVRFALSCSDKGCSGRLGDSSGSSTGGGRQEIYSGEPSIYTSVNTHYPAIARKYCSLLHTAHVVPMKQSSYTSLMHRSEKCYKQTTACKRLSACYDFYNV